MNPLYQAAIEIQQLVLEHHWRYCIIGGLAVVRWGQPRATQDVDVSLLTGLGSEEVYLDALLERFQVRRPDAREFALRNRVLLVQASNGVALDIALAAFPFEEKVIQHASQFAFAPGAILITASAEDLLVLKAFADRPKDWVDVEGIVIRQGGSLDWTYILAELTPLCQLKEDIRPIDRVSTLRRRVSPTP